MEDILRLSLYLRTLRGGRSQQDFARALGIAKSTVQALEQGRSAIRLDTLELLCGRLGLPVSLLLTQDAFPCQGTLLLLLSRRPWFSGMSAWEQQAVVQWLRQTTELWGRLKPPPAPSPFSRR